jgi:hypothetical protein
MQSDSACSELFASETAVSAMSGQASARVLRATRERNESAYTWPRTGEPRTGQIARASATCGSPRGQDGTPRQARAVRERSPRPSRRRALRLHKPPSGALVVSLVPSPVGPQRAKVLMPHLSTAEQKARADRVWECKTCCAQMVGGERCDEHNPNPEERERRNSESATAAILTRPKPKAKARSRRR